MFLIAGLGNPGPAYRATRHNVGFRTIELLATRHHAVWRHVDCARVASARVMTQETLLVQPMDFMNRSGEVIATLQVDHRPEGLVVVYDDMDLPVGRLRIRNGGGAGGHRGVASIIERCGAEFTRVRVGIGRPVAASSTADFVLSPFAAEEIHVIDAVIDGAANAVECVLSLGGDAAMSCYNGKVYSSGETVGSTGGERDAKV